MRKSTHSKRKKVIPDRLFNKLWTGAEKTNSKEEFIKKYTSPSSTEYVPFKKKFGIEYEESVILLSEIYDKQLMNFKEILVAAGKRKADISNTFCIPIRTVEEWYSGKNKCASYIRLMFIRQYHLLKLGKYIYTESEEKYKTSAPNVYEKKSTEDKEGTDKGSMDDGDEMLQDIDEWLKELERARMERKPVEDRSVKSILEKTSFLDQYLRK